MKKTDKRSCKVCTKNNPGQLKTNTMLKYLTNQPKKTKIMQKSTSLPTSHNYRYGQDCPNNNIYQQQWNTSSKVSQSPHRPSQKCSRSPPKIINRIPSSARDLQFSARTLTTRTYQEPKSELQTKETAR